MYGVTDQQPEDVKGMQEMVTLGSEDFGEHKAVFRIFKGIVLRAKPSSVHRHCKEVSFDSVWEQLELLSWGNIP